MKYITKETYRYIKPDVVPLEFFVPTILGTVGTFICESTIPAQFNCFRLPVQSHWPKLTADSIYVTFNGNPVDKRNYSLSHNVVLFNDKIETPVIVYDEVPVVDEEGNPVLDVDGNPVVELVPREEIIIGYPPVGCQMIIVVTMRYTGACHLNIAEYLIQGANITGTELDTELAENGQFVGGYRMKYEALNDPQYGTLTPCAHKLGWDYKPNVNYRGDDAFSYALETELGQRSEPECCTIHVGYWKVL